MAALFRFSEDVSEEELKTFIQKAISEKTKIARKYGLKTLKGNSQIDKMTRASPLSLILSGNKNFELKF